MRGKAFFSFVFLNKLQKKSVLLFRNLITSSQTPLRFSPFFSFLPFPPKIRPVSCFIFMERLEKYSIYFIPDQFLFKRNEKKNELFFKLDEPEILLPLVTYCYYLLDA